MTQKDNKGFLLLHLSVFIAGFTGVLGRLIELDSAVLVWHRMAWAAVLMALFLLFRKELQRYSLKDIAQMGGVGVLLCLHWIFFYASIKASNVSIGVVCCKSLFYKRLTPSRSTSHTIWNRFTASLSP